MMKIESIIPMIVDGLFGEPLSVSSCDCSDSSSTRLNESPFAFGSIFLFSVDFLVLRFF